MDPPSEYLANFGFMYYKNCQGYNYICIHVLLIIMNINQITMEGESYHKPCFKCAHGGCPLTLDSYASLDGILYCKHHFAQLFRVKGNYNHVLEAAKVKHGAAGEDHVESTHEEEKAEGASEENKPEEQPAENTDDQHPEDS